VQTNKPEPGTAFVEVDFRNAGLAPKRWQSQALDESEIARRERFGQL